MRRIFIITALIAVSTVMFVQNAVAQKLTETPIVKPARDYTSTPYYNKMARDALKSRPPRFDFMKFRSLYSRTRQYDPIGEKALKTINDLAYIILHDEDPERVKTALFAYQVEVSNHLAHIDIVMLALSLSREDKRFGKADFFEWMREGLIRTVVISGDGYTLSGAYDVITLSEEVILLNRLNFKPIGVQAAKEGTVYYNMHNVEDMQTGQKRTVFVNTSIPMKYLEAVKEEREEVFTLDIRKQ